MLDQRYVLANLDEVRRKTLRRGESSFDFDGYAQLAETRKTALSEFETTRAEQKSSSGAMRGLTPGSDEFNETRAALKTLSDRAKAHDEQAKQHEVSLQNALLELPNLLDDETPDGTSEDDNVEVRVSGPTPTFTFDAQDHVTLGEGLGLMDNEAAGRVTGARFVFLKGALAKLERALSNFMLDLHTTEHGYEEMLPPFLVNAASLTGTGQLPKFEADVFKTHRPGASEDPFYLIPTAEVPVTNYLRETLSPSYPGVIKYVASTPCFRSEAGSHGRDTRGLIRQHQFNKVELVKFAAAEESHAEHLLLLDNATTVLDRLGLAYRVVELCAADVGFSAKRCFDVEVWLPSQNKYREISSCSNFGDYQARRAGIRYRGDDGKPRFFHTINGSGLAVGRTLVAILENYQRADGSIKIPEALRGFMGCDELLMPG